MDEKIVYSGISTHHDVTIEVEEELFPCHKVILAARIPYFKSMFEFGMEKNSNKITLKDVPLWVFEKLHKFIYTGQLVLCITNIQEFLIMTVFFQTQDLQNICEEYVVERLALENVISFFQFAKQNYFKKILDSCKLFINKHFKDITETKEFSSMSLEEIDTLYVFLDNDLSSAEKLRGIDCWKSKNVKKKSEADKYDFSFRKNPLEKYVDLFAKKLHLSSKVEKCTTSITESKLLSEIYIIGGEYQHDCIPNVYNYTNSEDAIPLPQQRMMGCAQVLNNTIVIAGGCSDDSWFSSVYGCNVHSENWFILESMAKQRSLAGSCVIDDYMYVCGGFDGSTVVNDVTRYSLVYDNWESCTPMLAKREGLGVATIDNCIYALGGQTHANILDTIERLDTREMTWQRLKKLRKKRCGYGIASLNNTIYICGGFDGLHYLSCLEMYESRKDTWIKCKDMENARRNLQLVPYDGKLYAMGGYVGDANATKKVECYDPKTNKWSLAANLPFPLFSFSAVVL